MRIFIVLLFAILTTSIASAQQFGNSPATKSDTHVLNNPASDDRDGGETFADAIPVGALPWYDSGMTCDNIDDYDEICPFDTPGSPDVVYSWTATFTGAILVDLCGSLYDTKLYVYDSAFELVDCNDDYYTDSECGMYVSALWDIQIVTDETYYIVVDGYGGDCGYFNIEIDEYFIEIWPLCMSSVLYENEPPLEDEYVDQWNGGCNSDPPAFQWLCTNNANWCGTAGWYTFEGSSMRDTDWFECTAAGTTVTWWVEAESETNCIQVDIPDCDNPSVVQTMTLAPYYPGTMTINTTPGEIVHLFVGSVHYSNPGDVPGDEYQYEFEISGIVETSSTEQQTWSGVKSLYR